MNRLMVDYYPTFAQYQALRAQMLDLLTDADLAYQPSAATATLGTLCREIGETQYGYIESLKSGRHDFSYHNPEPMLAAHVVTLKEWYAQLDTDLRTIIEAMSDEDLAKTIDRGGWSIPIKAQLEIYKEALLIFYGKADIYLKMLGKPLPEQWHEWIA
jgi:hypothetical protein